MAENSSRRAIEFLVYGALPPHSTNVLWMDSSDPTLPVLKIWWNGAWVPVHTDKSKEVAELAKAVERLTLTNSSQQSTIVNLTNVTAKEATLTNGIDTIIAAIRNIDLSSVAKQGTNDLATNTAILEAVAKDSTVAKQATMVSSFAAVEGSVGNVRGDTKLLRSYIALPKHITVSANNNTYVCDFYQLDKSYSAWKPQNQDGIVIRVYEPIEAGVSCTVITPTSQYGGTITTIGKLVSLSEILSKFDDIYIDTTTLAKETSVKDGNDTAIGVAKDVRSEVGTGSDTAAESGTLFAVVKWIKDKVVSIYNAVTNGTYGLSAIQSLIGYTISEIDSI